MGESTAVARYAAEFVGTFMLVFTVGCNVLTHQSIWGGVSIACVLMVMIYALGKSSGGHFNPAVSITLGLAAKMDENGGWTEVGIYIAVQLLAGIFASLSYIGMFGKTFNLEPTVGHTWWQAGLAELLYTFMLCFVVLNVAASKVHAGNNQFYGLAIGFVIVAGAYSGGAVSMGCFNPAVAFGIDVSSVHYAAKYCLVYAAFELVGAALAAGAFNVCRGQQELGETAEAAARIKVGLPSKLLAEFVGTYMLVLTVGLNVLSGSGAGAFSIAACLMCMIFALATVSGAHFNPAVTTAIICSGRDKITLSDGAAYVVVQIFGGVCAAFTYSLLMNGATFALKPTAYSWSQVTIAELMFTLVLAFVVLSVGTVKNPSQYSQYAGLAVGMCVTVGGFAVGKVSGGSLNPAVSIGISSANLLNGGSFWSCVVYTVVELAAGIIAAGIFKLTQPSEYEDMKGEDYGSTA